MKKLLLALFTLSLLTFIGLTLIIFRVVPEEWTASLFSQSNFTNQVEPKDIDPNLPETTFETSPTNSNANGKIPRKVSYEERLKKGDLLLENNYLTLAIQEYSLAAEAKPEAADPFVKIGLIHLKNKTYDKAVANFKIVLDKNNQDQNTKINLVRAYLGQNDFTNAVNILSQANHNEQITEYYQGLLNIVISDYNKSKEAFKKAMEINTNPDVTSKSQKILQTYQTYENAKDAPQTYLKTLLGKTLNEVEQYHISLKLLDEVIKATPEYRDAWILHGYALLNINNYTQSLESFKKALELDPEKAETRYFLGLAYFGLNKMEQAITEMEVAIHNGFEPKIQIQQKLAEMYLLKQDYESSMKYYEQVLANKNIPLDYYVRPVWILLELIKQPDRALNIANSASLNYPGEAMSYNLLGWAYTYKKDYAAATQNLEKALEINPNLGAAHLNLGRVYEEQNELEKAKESYKKAYELNKGDSVGNLAAQRYNELLKKTENK